MITKKNTYYIHSVGSISNAKGGPSRSVTSLCSYLADLGVLVALVTANDSKDKCFPQNKLVNIEQTNYSFFLEKTGYSFYKKLSTFSSKIKIKIIHDHGLWMPNNFWTAYWAKKNMTPLILSPRGMLEPWSLSHKPVKKKLALLFFQRKILNKVDIFFATSKEEAKNIRALGLKQPIAVIPNGVEIPNFSLNQKVYKKKKTILFLSRIHPKKGLINLVHAWKIVRSPDWKIQIAGNDENNHLLEILSEIKKLELEDDFEFTGMIDGHLKNKAYKDADLFILPTFSENFGIVVAEALSYGLPVITTTGTPWSSLIDNQCGWWVEPNMPAIASALRDAMSLSDEQRMKMGERGITFVRNNFSWESIAKQTISVYKWVLGEGSKPSCILD